MHAYVTKMAQATPQQAVAVEAFLKASGLLTRTSIIRDVLALKMQEEPSFEDLIDKVDADKPLAQRLIHVANSAWFASTVKIDSCASAFTRCGSEEFCQIAIHSCARQALAEVSDSIWPHLEFSAQFCQILAQQIDSDLETSAHWAGLFHDYAVPYMVKDLTDYSYLMQDAMGFTADAIGNEQECYGLDHAQVAAQIVKEWGFPSEVSEAISKHHAGEMFAIGLSPLGAKLASVLIIAKHVEAAGAKIASNPAAFYLDAKISKSISSALSLSEKALKDFVTEACHLVAVRAVTPA